MMSRSAATCAGSSGGAQPPRDPRRVSSSCESATELPGTGKEKRKKRGIAKGNNIINTVAKDGKVKIQFDTKRQTWKAIGAKSSWWSSAIGIHTRDCCEPFYDRWDDVPTYQKSMIRQRMLDWFENENDEVFDEVVNRDARECYNDWKSDLCDYFKNSGGVQALKPENVRTDEQWRRCCERFSSAKFKEISGKNSKNREACDDKSGHGRKSYAQYLHEKDNPLTGEQSSAIENWKDHRMTRDGEWRTNEAHEKYIKMNEEYQKELEQSGSTSVDETKIMNRNLKKHRGRQSGVGPTLSKGASHRIEDGCTSAFQDHRDVRISELEANQELILSALRRFIPGFELPSRTPHNDIHSTSSANQDGETEADDDLNS